MNPIRARIAVVSSEQAGQPWEWITDDEATNWSAIDDLLDLPFAIVDRVFELYCRTYLKIFSNLLLKESYALFEYTRCGSCL